MGELTEIFKKVHEASRSLTTCGTDQINQVLFMLADATENNKQQILAANADDLARMDVNNPKYDRLKLTEERIHAIAEGIRNVALLPSPVGKVLAEAVRPNGMKLTKVSVPFGVIGIIYEARPNVTVDAAGICLKSGNAVILRGGSEAIHSSIALADCIVSAGVAAGMPEGAVQLLPFTTHEAVSVMLKMDQFINLIIPRGGERLIRTVVEQSTIPVIKHYKGVCHVYVDKAADLKMALDIIENGKCQRPGVCNAVETVLLHSAIAEEFASAFAERMAARGVELRGDETFCRLVPAAKEAVEDDYYAEYLSLILAVKTVGSVEDAAAHIGKYGSGHSDAIVTMDTAAAEYFLDHVDSAAVYWNASTRFTDGGEFGMGAEIGISTDKLHARGPMGLAELTTYKYKIFGTGQIR